MAPTIPALLAAALIVGIGLPVISRADDTPPLVRDFQCATEYVDLVAEVLLRRKKGLPVRVEAVQLTQLAPAVVRDAAESIIQPDMSVANATRALRQACYEAVDRYNAYHAGMH